MKLRSKIFFSALSVILTAAFAAQGHISIVGGLTHEKQAELGEIYRGSLMVRNEGSRPQEIKIYKTDYMFRCDGTKEYGPAGGLVRSNANWLRFRPNRMILPVAETVAVDYKLQVPEGDPNLIGTYWSILMVEEVPVSSPESSLAGEAGPQVTITQIIRYGVQMITHIEETGERKLEFLGTKLVREEEKRFLHVDVGNVGQRWLRPFLWAELYDDAGRYIGRFENNRKRVFPDTSVRFRVDLSEVPKGSYQGLVVADCGGDDIFGVNITLELDE